MKFSPFFKKITLAVATVGMVAPQASLLLATETQAKRQEQQVLTDVSLTAEHKLVGQVVDGKGIARANSSLTITTAQGEVVKKIQTDSKGMFQAELAKGGIYTVAGNQVSSSIRVWTNQAAPPTANTGILVVDDTEEARGQGFGGFFRRADGGLRWGLIGVTGGVIGGAIIAASQQNSAS